VLFLVAHRIKPAPVMFSGCFAHDIHAVHRALPHALG
jgi:hypothetical protein